MIAVFFLRMREEKHLSSKGERYAIYQRFYARGREGPRSGRWIFAGVCRHSRPRTEMHFFPADYLVVLRRCLEDIALRCLPAFAAGTIGRGGTPGAAGHSSSAAGLGRAVQPGLCRPAAQGPAETPPPPDRRSDGNPPITENPTKTGRSCGPARPNRGRVASIPSPRSTCSAMADASRWA